MRQTARGLVAAADMDVVRAVFAAFTERDVERAISHADPGVELIAVTGDQAGQAQPYRGHEGIRQYFRDVAAVWEEIRLMPGDFRQDGDTILVTGRVSARSAARVVAGSTGWIWRLRAGKVTYARVYPSAAEAIAAFKEGPA
jgi:ketosteroid isomerase-like protein